MCDMSMWTNPDYCSITREPCRCMFDEECVMEEQERLKKQADALGMESLTEDEQATIGG